MSVTAGPFQSLSPHGAGQLTEQDRGERCGRKAISTLSFPSICAETQATHSTNNTLERLSAKIFGWTERGGPAFVYIVLHHSDSKATYENKKKKQCGCISG